MKEKFEPIFLDGQMIDVDNVSLENAGEILRKLQEQQAEIRIKIDAILKSGDQKKLVDLLEDLKNVQKNLSILRFVKFDKETSAKVGEKVSEETDKFKKPENASESLSKFKSALESVRTEYANEFKVLLAILGEGQKHEITAVVAASQAKDDDTEIEEGEKSETLESPENPNNASIESLRETIVKIEEYIDECANRCNQKMDELTEEVSLAVPETKKGLFNGFFGKIFGSRDKDTEKNLNTKTNFIEKVIPKIKEEIKEKLVKKIIEICATKKGAPVRAAIAKKVAEMLPAITEAAVTVGSIVTSTVGVQALAIAGLATAAIVTTKVIVDKVRESKANEGKTDDAKTDEGKTGEEPEKIDAPEVVKEGPDDSDDLTL